VCISPVSEASSALIQIEPKLQCGFSSRTRNFAGVAAPEQTGDPTDRHPGLRRDVFSPARPQTPGNRKRRGMADGNDRCTGLPVNVRMSLQNLCLVWLSGLSREQRA